MSKILKMIAVDTENYGRLRKMGCAGESFNDVLNRILNEVEGKTKKETSVVEAVVLSK